MLNMWVKRFIIIKKSKEIFNACLAISNAVQQFHCLNFRLVFSAQQLFGSCRGILYLTVAVAVVCTASETVTLFPLRSLSLCIAKTEPVVYLFDFSGCALRLNFDICNIKKQLERCPVRKRTRVFRKKERHSL